MRFDGIGWAVIVAGLTVLGWTANARAVDVRYSGKIDGITGTLPPEFNGVNVGDSYSVSYSYSTNLTPEQLIPDHTSIYFPSVLEGYQLTIGSTVYTPMTFGEDSQTGMSITDDGPIGDIFIDTATMAGGAIASLSLTDTSSSALSSQDLPATLDFGAFNIKLFGLVNPFGAEPQDQYEFSGTVEEFSLVPEPTMWVAIGLASLLVLGSIYFRLSQGGLLPKT